MNIQIYITASEIFLNLTLEASAGLVNMEDKKYY